jgi:hypothetical protein
MKEDASRKKPSPRDICAQKRAQLSLAELDKVATGLETRLSNLEDLMKMVVTPPVQRIARLHVQAHGSASDARLISTGLSPDPLETWPDKQDVKDIKI